MKAMKKVNQFKVFLIVSGIVALLATISFTMGRDSNNLIVRSINDGVSLVQRGVVQVVHGIRDRGEAAQLLFSTFEDNQRLRSQMYNYQLLNVQTQDYREQLDAALQMLEIEATLSDFERVNAVTIGRDMPHWDEFIIINRGSQHGLEEEMAVLSREGYLIGRVTEVNRISARVHLHHIENERMGAHVIVQGDSESTGMFEGYDPILGELVVTQVDRNVEVEIGGRVITTGYGGVYPRGLLVGHVSRYEISSDGLTQTLFLTNDVNYNDLSFVFVIKRALPGANL